MLIEDTLFGTIDKVQLAIDRLREHEPPQGYYLAFSGGKDSCVIKALADLADVKYDAHYSVTTIDPPELVYFIRAHHPDVIWDRPPKAFLHEIVTSGFPLRQARWCCAKYKERGGEGRVCVIGIRAEESSNRSGRDIYGEYNGKTYLYPIYEWTELDIWDFIEAEQLPYCGLYEQGFERIGCVFCPMKSAGRKEMERKRWPRFENAFRAAFKRLYDNRKSRGMASVDRWPNSDAMFEWWLTGKA